ncbi:MAG: tetratricopeptide repeat protein [Chloroherpetonaceae bacterium]|nr:tetratricopeptide repeat protein [Chloroherpetonaceae bacterium]MDW8018836.1 tetratricopeptide repeat protein [Chloroherpetonaceae bacterium]
MRLCILLCATLLAAAKSRAQTADELYASGLAHLSNEAYSAALVDFNKAIAKDPSYWRAYWGRAYTQWLYLQDTAAALTDYTRAIELAPNEADLYYYRGLLRQELGQHARANIDFTRAILLNPNNADYFFQRGRSRLAIEEYALGIEDFSEVLKRVAESSSAYFYRGYAKLSLEKALDAIEDFTASLSLVETAEAYYYRAIAYRKLRQYNSALSDLNRALRLRPAFSDAYFMRGVVKAEMGQKEEGIADATLARKLGYQPKGRKARKISTLEDSLYVYSAPEVVVEAERPEYREALRDTKQLAVRGRNALATRIISVTAPITFLPSTPPSPISSFNTVDCNKQTLMLKRLTEVNLLCIVRLLREEARQLKDAVVDNIIAQISDMATELATLEDNLLRGAMPETAAAVDRQRRIQLLVNVQQLMTDLQEHLDRKSGKKE